MECRADGNGIAVVDFNGIYQVQGNGDAAVDIGLVGNLHKVVQPGLQATAITLDHASRIDNHQVDGGVSGWHSSGCQRCLRACRSCRQCQRLGHCIVSGLRNTLEASLLPVNEPVVAGSGY